MSPVARISGQVERLESYLDVLTRYAGHADRVAPIENYFKGLLLPLVRKSVEPMAARLAPGNVRRMHQIVAARTPQGDGAPAPSVAA